MRLQDIVAERRRGNARGTTLAVRRDRGTYLPAQTRKRTRKRLGGRVARARCRVLEFRGSSVPPLRDGHRESRKEETLANIKSQKKRILTNAKAQARNKAVRSEVKTAIKKVDAAVAAGDKSAASDAALAASRKLDKAASKGVIHPNQAANRKSGVMRKVNSLEG